VDDLTRDLGELVGVTNDLASSLKSAPAISVTATERGVAVDLAKLQRNGFESSAVNPLSDKIRTYVAGVDRERRLALDGRTGEVQALSGQQDALFHILATQAASVVQQLRRQADDASRMV